MPLFAPPSSPAPAGKDRCRRPPSQRARNPLGEHKPCNNVVRREGEQVLPKKVVNAIPRPVNVKHTKEVEVEEVLIPTRRAGKAAGRYGHFDNVAGRVHGLKRVGLKPCEGGGGAVAAGRVWQGGLSRRAADGDRVRDGINGFRGDVDWVPWNDGLQSGDFGSDGCKESLEDELEPPGAGVASSVEVAEEVDVGAIFGTPGCSDDDDDEMVPLVETASSPEFVRKLKGSGTPAGRGCFAAGPLVGSGGTVRDRRKCKPRGVLIVGAEECLPSLADESKEDGKETVPKRSVASVEWMVADEEQEWNSSFEVFSSAVGMSVSFQGQWESTNDFVDMQEKCSWKEEADWELSLGAEHTCARRDADANCEGCVPVELQTHEAEGAALLGLDPAFQFMQELDCSHSLSPGVENKVDTATYDGETSGPGAGCRPRLLEEFDIIDNELYLSLDASDHLSPVRCSSPPVKGKWVSGRGRRFSDVEGDLVVGACESIKPGRYSVLDGSDDTAWQSCAVFHAEESRHHSGTCRSTSLRQTTPVDTVGKVAASTQSDGRHYMVPTNSPESKDIRYAHSEQGGDLIVHPSGLRFEPRYMEEDVEQLLSTETQSGFHQSGSTYTGMTDKGKHVENVDSHGYRYGTAHDSLQSGVLRKNKICTEKYLARMQGVPSQLTALKFESKQGSSWAWLNGENMLHTVEKDVPDKLLPDCPNVLRHPKPEASMLGSRVRSLSGLLNSQEVRDELGSESNSKLFRKKYPRRQPGEDSGKASADELVIEKAMLVSSRPSANMVMDYAEAERAEEQILGPGHSLAHAALEANLDAMCNTKPTKRGNTRYASRRCTTPCESIGSTDMFLPSRSFRTFKS